MMCRIPIPSLVLLLIVVILSCISIDGATTATPLAIPIAPTSYSTVVSLNVVSGGWNNAYAEWKDSARHLVRMDGRFTRSTITQIYDYNNDILWQWDKHNTTFPCSVVPISTFLANVTGTHPCQRMFYEPSTTLFDCFIELNATYNGTSTATRNIPSDVWVASRTLTFNANFSYTINLVIYFAQDNIAGIQRVPVRAEMHGQLRFNGTVTPVDAYWDWTDWVSGAPDPSIFTTPSPTSCIQQNISPLITIPTESTVLPVASDAAKAHPPSLPTQFAAVVEIVSSDSSLSVVSTWWRFAMPQDAATRYERIDYVELDEGDTITVVYQYIRQDSTPTTGKTLVPGAGITYTLDQGKCTRGTITGEEVSPLSVYRAGFTPTLFTNPSLLTGATYKNRTFARGVMCDVYTRNTLSWSAGTKLYSFSTDIYFFPEGFQFPGRDLPPGFRMPMRVVNTGYMTDINGDGTSQTYNDKWDFFLLNPSPQNVNDWFNMTAQCPVVFVPDFNISPSSAGATVAAIFGSIAGFACLVGLYNRFRRVQRMKKREHRKILGTLTNKNVGLNELEQQQQPSIEPEPEHQQPDIENQISQEHGSLESDDEYGTPQEDMEQPQEEPQETYEDDDPETTEESVIAAVQHAKSSGSRSPVR